ncbi:transcriptional regulator, XRE family [Streptomyces malaysiensis]|uniref:Transcriptional regulator, XRE family n=1 Tax=Streptomyces malaysiensis TaxID=92644 RepID=A0A7X5X6Q0_STRMQ|nr:transcriptional regulator, XRE family [Streptomyces malaysiensis]
MGSAAGPAGCGGRRWPRSATCRPTTTRAWNGSGGVGEHINPGLLRILGHLQDTPAEIITELGETLRQTPLGVALTGDTTGYTGPDRSLGYRWFTGPSIGHLYAPEEHPFLTRMFASNLREVATLRGPGSRAAYLVDLLLARSEEFRTVWNDHEIHPELGALELNCQQLIDPDQAHTLLVYTAIPGSESYE